MENPEVILNELLANDASVRLLARHLVAGHADADDVVQDAWVAALRNPPRQQGTVSSWFSKVVRRIAWSQRESQDRRRRTETEIGELDFVEAHRVEAARHKVATAVFALEEPYRTAVYLRYFEDLPPRKIAEHLSITVAAVEGRLRRGLQKLRARLDSEFGDRESWCAAFLPLIGQGTTTGAGTSIGTISASLLTGALVMSTKIKVGIAIILAVGVAYAFWPRAEVKPLEEPAVETVQPAAREDHDATRPDPIAATTAEPRAIASEPQSTAMPKPISLEPTRGAIVGAVTEPDGTPIAGASVEALQLVPGAVELETLVTTITDGAGRYALKPIAERCVVEARASGHFADRCTAEPFSRQDFVLGEPGILKGKLVMASTGTPCVDAAVGVYDWRRTDPFENVKRTFAWKRPPEAAMRSTRTGEYRFDRLRPGRYQLYVIPRDHPPAHTRDTLIEIQSRQETVRDIAITTGIRLLGQVSDAATSRPVPGANVYLHNRPRRRTNTDAEGRYTLGSIAPWPDHEFLVVEAVGYVPRTYRIQPVAAFTGERVIDIKLERGVLIAGRVIGPDGSPVASAEVAASSWLLRIPEERWSSAWHAWTSTTDERGAFRLMIRPSEKARCIYAAKADLAWGVSEPFVPRTGEKMTGVLVRLTHGSTVHGQVLDDAGRPVDAARITLHEDKGGPGLRTTRTRGDGRFEIDAVPDGTYELKVVPPGVLARARSPFADVCRQGVTVASGERADVTLTLRKGPVIAGRVVDRNGRPLEDVVIRAYPRTFPNHIELYIRVPSRRTTSTDALGRFCVEGCWDLDIPYFLQARKTGYAEGYAREIRPGNVDVVITLEEAKELQGRVVYGSTGQPAREFRIQGFTIPRPGGDQRRRKIRSSNPRDCGVFADLGGRFTVSVKPGEYEIEAQTPDGQRSDLHTVTVPSVGKPEFLELKVWRGTTLCGILRLPDGTTPSYGDIQIWKLGESPPKAIRSTRIDSSGRFEVVGLSVGRYLVAASGGVRGGLPCEGTRDVEITTTGPKEITLPLGPGTEVGVCVVTRDHQPVQGAKVTISRTNNISNPALRLSERRSFSTYMQARLAAGSRPTQEEIRRYQEDLAHRLRATDADGKLAPLFLIPAEYVIEVNADGFATGRKIIHIGSCASQTIEIVLEKA